MCYFSVKNELLSCVKCMSPELNGNIICTSHVAVAYAQCSSSNSRVLCKSSSTQSAQAGIRYLIYRDSIIQAEYRNLCFWLPIAKSCYCLNQVNIGVRNVETRFTSMWTFREYELCQDSNPRQDGSDKIRYAHSKSNAVMVNSPVSVLIQKEEWIAARN